VVTLTTALDDMEVLSTTVQKARAWLNQHLDFNRTFLPYLGRQMHALADQVADLSLYDTEARLARLILRHLAPDNFPDDIRLINDLSQETLASMIGSVRVVVTRHLQKWKQKKIISGRRGRWSVLDLQALLEKAEHQLRDRTR
jgi:CRP/FNR family cyclic AMP-dependent transcriptional regulator